VKKRKRATPPEVDETHEDITHGLDVPLGLGASSNPLLQSTPLAGRARDERQEYTINPSSPLPPSSPPPASSPRKVPPDDDDDPFGFLVVEKKLKEQRAQTRQRVYDENGIEDLYATDEDYGPSGGQVHTPAARAGTAGSMGSPESRVFHTPSKHSNKRSRIEYPTPRAGSSTPRILSSPSPVKHAEPELMDQPTPKAKAVKVRGKKNPHMAVDSDKVEEMEPWLKAEHLESLLPKRMEKRPVRKATQKYGNKRKADEGSDSENDRGTKRNKTTTAAKKRKPVSKGKGRKTEKADVSYLDEEQEVGHHRLFTMLPLIF